MLAGLLAGWRNGRPAERQLAATVRALVLDGRLPLEARVPAERELAAALGISRSTVTAAYNMLRRDGYLRSRQGAGSWVTMPGGHRAASDTRLSGDRARLADRRTARSTGARRARGRRAAGAPALARPSRLRPARLAAPSGSDRATLHRSRAADDQRADSRRQRSAAGARSDGAGAAAARPCRPRRDSGVPGVARRASGGRGARARSCRSGPPGGISNSSRRWPRVARRSRI